VKPVFGAAPRRSTTAINKGGASCYAQSTSSALNKIVQNVINVQHQ
jgi:hypothetical protein